MIYAGTGHRPDKLGGYGEDVLDKLISVIRNNLPKDCTKIITGMALGWDTALARAAMLEKIPFIAAVPFYGQEAVWPKQSQEYYHDLLNNAEDVFYICDKGYAAWKMQVRNEWMVDNCDVILALWNGTAGGTQNCLKYAEKKNKPIVNLWQAYGSP